MKEEPIVKLNGTEFSPVEGETLRTQVLSFFMSQGGSANTPFGNVLLDKRGVKNDLSHPNYLNKTHAFAAVKDVLEKGKVTTPFDYHDVHGKKQPTGIITGYIVIGEQPFKMDVTVIGNADGEMRLYCHDVYQIPITENHQKSIITKNILGASSLYPSCNSLGEYANVNKNNKNMKKKVIKLNENTLKQIVAESVKKVLKEYELSDREKDIMRGYWGDIENRRMPKQKYEPVNPQSWKKSTPNNQTPKHYQYDNQYSQMKESAGGIDLMFDRQSELDDKPEATPKGYIIVNDDGAGFTRSGIYGTPAWTGQLDARQFGGVTVYKSLAAAKRVAKKIGGTVRGY